ncbi:hypothetical protein [Enterococcus cecorum]|nr:hypothetical protein [Enterococcus cecorum]MDZ5560994.1 hypothetical protein [Enterococcus cecorum]CAI3415312.1 hypothetical protein CIRMBP1307_01072 [Enterococcus cecorum]CAI3445628.1 hypothetical protein CIRMBP1308_01277 [Enterococcus cecorum]
MPASSITHNFVISNPKSINRFVKAIEESDRDRTPKEKFPGHQLTDSKEILALMSKLKRYIKTSNFCPSFN